VLAVRELMKLSASERIRPTNIWTCQGWKGQWVRGMRGFGFIIPEVACNQLAIESARASCHNGSLCRNGTANSGLGPRSNLDYWWALTPVPNDAALSRLLPPSPTNNKGGLPPSRSLLYSKSVLALRLWEIIDVGMFTFCFWNRFWTR
jgi:hypothetical protein